MEEDVLTWVNALEQRARRKLESQEAAAIAALPIVRRRLSVHDHVCREGDTAIRCGYVLSGALYQTKFTIGGDRQIVGLRLQNEFVGVQDLLLQSTAHDIQALAESMILEIDAVRLRATIAAHAGLAAILMADVMVSCSIAQDWIVNVGRRDAQARVAHLLCELALRMHGSSLTPGARYRLPLTQLELGDALGLGRVAVNRVLRDLTDLGVAACERSCITILDSARLETIGDFTARYLHLGHSERERRGPHRGAVGSLASLGRGRQSGCGVARRRPAQSHQA